MECIVCGGTGCDKCEKTGVIRIEDCPLKLITSDVWEIIEYATLYRKGLPPIHGGALDQAQNFIEVSRFVFREQAYWKNKLGMFD